jgi:hypothetical protein
MNIILTKQQKRYQIMSRKEKKSYLFSTKKNKIVSKQSYHDLEKENECVFSSLSFFEILYQLINIKKNMSAAGQNSRYSPNTFRGQSAKPYQQNSSSYDQKYTNGWDTNKSTDRFGYNDQYQTKTSFLDKYRTKTDSYYSPSKDINNR